MMIGDDSFHASTADAEIEFFGRQLNSVKDLLLIRHGLLQQELRRLNGDTAAEKAVARALAERENTNAALLRMLDEDEEVAGVVVPEVPPEGALIHGRVLDATKRGIPGLIARIEGENGKGPSLIAQAPTRKAGYFAFPLEAETLGSRKDRRLFLAVETSTGDVLHRDSEPMEVVANTKLFRTVSVAQMPSRPPKTASRRSPDPEVAGQPERGQEPEIETKHRRSEKE